MKIPFLLEHLSYVRSISKPNEVKVSVPVKTDSRQNKRRLTIEICSLLSDRLHAMVRQEISYTYTRGYFLCRTL